MHAMPCMHTSKYMREETLIKLLSSQITNATIILITNHVYMYVYIPVCKFYYRCTHPFEMPLNLSLIILAATQPGKCVFNSSSDASGGNLPTNIVADKDPWTASEKPKITKAIVETPLVKRSRRYYNINVYCQ